MGIETTGYTPAAAASLTAEDEDPERWGLRRGPGGAVDRGVHVAEDEDPERWGLRRAAAGALVGPLPVPKTKTPNDGD